MWTLSKLQAIRLRFRQTNAPMLWLAWWLAYGTKKERK